MRSTARSSTTGRVCRALIGLGTAAGFALVAPAVAHADPAGCTRAGENITCTAGIPAGEALTGSANANVTTTTGGKGGNGCAGPSGFGGLGGAAGAGGAGNTGTVNGGLGTNTIVNGTGGLASPGRRCADWPQRFQAPWA